MLSSPTAPPLPAAKPVPPPAPVRAALPAAWPVALCAFFGAASEILLKLGASETARLTIPFPAWLGLTGLASWWTWASMVCQILSFLAWLKAIKILPLSVAFTLANVTHVLVPLGSWCLLGETIGLRRWLGISLVMAGLILTARPYAKLEAREPGAAP